MLIFRVIVRSFFKKNLKILDTILQNFHIDIKVYVYYNTHTEVYYYADKYYYR
jgi:hypothetical protein